MVTVKGRPDELPMGGAGPTLHSDYLTVTTPTQGIRNNLKKRRTTMLTSNTVHRGYLVIAAMLMASTARLPVCDAAKFGLDCDSGRDRAKSAFLVGELVNDTDRPAEREKTVTIEAKLEASAGFDISIAAASVNASVSLTLQDRVSQTVPEHSKLKIYASIVGTEYQCTVTVVEPDPGVGYRQQKVTVFRPQGISITLR